MRVFVPSLIGFLLLFSSFAVAQPGSMTVQIESSSDGKTATLEEQTFDQASFVVRDFLLAKRDGTIRLSEGDVMMLELRVSGEQVHLTNAGGTQTTTVSSALANFETARANGHFAACKSKQKTLATALEHWAGEHKGRYPDSLAQLVPKYLEEMISCTEGKGDDTYGSRYKARQNRDHFVLQCTVDHSAAGFGAGVPAYDSDFGLIEREADLKLNFRP